MRRRLLSLVIIMAASSLGCGQLYFNRGRSISYAPDAGHHDLWDLVFRRRHPDLKGPVQGDPMLQLARDLTVMEDDIRRDGSITIKTPDVWGDANLIASIQEYERLMAPGTPTEFASRFSETLQAYIARSDQGEFQSTTAIAQALSGASLTQVTSTTSHNTSEKLTAKEGSSSESGSTVGGTTDNTKGASTLNNKIVPDAEAAPKPFALLGAPMASTTASKGIGLEPTELDRQRSTFLHANQALRRKMMGDDNSRAAGYGLYLFRIPVSVLPGRETTEGYSAVATLRAQIQVDQAHLKNTFPKLVIADLVESLTPRLMTEWNDGVKLASKIREIPPARRNEIQKELNGTLKERIAQIEEKLRVQSSAIDQQSLAPASLGHSPVAVPSTVPFTSHTEVFGEEQMADLVLNAVEYFQSYPIKLNPPKIHEIKEYLSSTFAQTHNVLIENRVYDLDCVTIARAGELFCKGQYDQVQNERKNWELSISQYQIDKQFENASWFLALQSGIFDRNLKKIINDIESIKNSTVGQNSCDNIFFFTSPNQEALTQWEIVVRESFPLHVFSLDPIVEEQNAYDTFSRRREMQVALAFSVAKGSILSADQKLKMSRNLALDEATIALNRTAVAFAHGDDTFGWYFHPRIQTPPTESSNIGALARTIWSTGPTEHYDRKHRRLEPGIRECEVLIAMPSFVTNVSFDVNTNWEKIARPGVTKRSYEEMLAQGRRLHQLRMCMQAPNNQQCYRPGDFSRILSRIDQMESMLGMQTYSVRLPYQYDQSGTGLFDTGKRQQAPMLEYFYGLTYLDPEQTVADLFITGRNFHPTLTHVVIGGSEKHSADTDVEVISRELIKVRLGNLRKTLSNDGSFEVRVSTPAGISNLLVIDQKKSEPPKDEKSIYDFAGTIELSGTISCNSEPKMNCCSVFCIDSGLGDLRIVTKPSHSFSHPNGKISLNLQRVRTGSDTVPLGTTNGIPLANSNLEFKSLIDAISPLIENRTDYQNGDVIVASGSLEFPGSSESPVNMTSQIKIKIRLGTCSGTKDCNSPSGEENLPAPNDQSGVMFPERLRVAPRLQYNSIR